MIQERRIPPCSLEADERLEAASMQKEKDLSSCLLPKGGKHHEFDPNGH